MDATTYPRLVTLAEWMEARPMGKKKTKTKTKTTKQATLQDDPPPDDLRQPAWCDRRTGEVLAPYVLGGTPPPPDEDGQQHVELRIPSR
jgi:hypothetical protein